METMITVDNGDVLAGIRGFLRRLMDSGVVEAIYVPLQTGSGAITPALVTDPSRLETADPLAPVMPINGARAVSALTGKHAPARLAAVLRPCEIRALVELVKLQQATLEGLTLIAMDCAGTCEVPKFYPRRPEGGYDLGGYLANAAAGETPEGWELRPACQMCIHPSYEGAAITLGLFGADLQQGVPVSLSDEIAEALGITGNGSSATGGARQQALERLVGARQEVRQAELGHIRGQLSSGGGMLELFATCIRCHNCMTVCPICYCKTCLFRSESMSHPPEYYLNAAKRKGAVRMLSDTLLFHMTRLTHMETSCVSCGMCTSACPAEIPVGAIFTAIGEQVQAAFEYQPGRNVDEPLPLITFQANEWTEVGEAR
jgi:formate dehydrogenase subunit beta